MISTREACRGFNPVATDIVTALFMGLDPARIPLLTEARNLKRWPLMEQGQEIRVADSGDAALDLDGFASSSSVTPFVPAAGWVGHIEMEADAGSVPVS